MNTQKHDHSQNELQGSKRSQRTNVYLIKNNGEK